LGSRCLGEEGVFSEGGAVREVVRGKAGGQKTDLKELHFGKKKNWVDTVRRGFGDKTEGRGRHVTQRPQGKSFKLKRGKVSAHKNVAKNIIRNWSTTTGKNARGETKSSLEKTREGGRESVGKRHGGC